MALINKNAPFVIAFPQPDWHEFWVTTPKIHFSCQPPAEWQPPRWQGSKLVDISYISEVGRNGIGGAPGPLRPLLPLVVSTADVTGALIWGNGLFLEDKPLVVFVLIGQ